MTSPASFLLHPDRDLEPAFLFHSATEISGRNRKHLLFQQPLGVFLLSFMRGASNLHRARICCHCKECRQGVSECTPKPPQKVPERQKRFPGAMAMLKQLLGSKSPGRTSGKSKGEPRGALIGAVCGLLSWGRQGTKENHKAIVWADCTAHLICMDLERCCQRSSSAPSNYPWPTPAKPQNGAEEI